MKIRKGDRVRVLTGKDRGKEGVVMLALRFGQSGAATDAGIAVADAGPAAHSVVDAGPPPPPPPPLVVKSVDVVAKGAPSRVRWLVDGRVVGIGSGTLTVPDGTKSMVAEDLRWKSTATVPVTAGVVDYESVPTGTVQLVRTSDKTIIRLGDDDVSRQRKLKMVVGRYVFKVERDGKVKDIPVEVAAGKTITIDASR